MRDLVLVLCPGDPPYAPPHVYAVTEQAIYEPCSRCGCQPAPVTWEPIVAVHRLAGWDAVDDMLGNVQPPWLLSRTAHVYCHAAMVLLGELPDRWREQGFAVGYELAVGGWRMVHYPPLEWPALDADDVACKIERWQYAALGREVRWPGTRPAWPRVIG